MAKKKKHRHNQDDANARASSPAAVEEAETGPPPKMKRKEYERQMRILHGELVAMQEWVKDSGAKICIVFEGRDTAGKGGTIKRITERVSPRVFRVVALPTPTEREKSQMYIQRYLPHFPAAGEVVIFDRSWYNRAGVERVMGFCTPQETDRFLGLVPGVEKAMVDDGILLLKYWLEVGPDEQTRRLKSRMHDPRKIWKLSPMDLKSYSRWYDYSRARDAMFAATDTAQGPWYIADADDKKRARLNIISHLLSQVPYKPLAPRDIRLPDGSLPAATSSRTCHCGTSRHRSRRQAAGPALTASCSAGVVAPAPGPVRFAPNSALMHLRVTPACSRVKRKDEPVGIWVNMESPDRLRSFDPFRVADLEHRMWVAYYLRRRLRLLMASVRLLRLGFGTDLPRTLQGAWLMLRAVQLWAPFPDNDPDGAQGRMHELYALVRLRFGGPRTRHKQPVWRSTGGGRTGSASTRAIPRRWATSWSSR